MKLIWWLVIIIATIGIIGCGLYTYSLSKVTVERVNVAGVNDLTMQGFTLSGQIIVNNEGLLPVKMDHVQYDIFLDSSGEKLSSGHVEGQWISPRHETSLHFRNEIYWRPSAELAFNLVTNRNTYATIDGTVYLARFMFMDFKVPFSEQVDLEPYIKQFIITKKEQVIQAVGDGLKAVGETIKEGFNNAVDTVKGWFD